MGLDAIGVGGSVVTMGSVLAASSQSTATLIAAVIAALASSQPLERSSPDGGTGASGGRGSPSYSRTATPSDRSSGSAARCNELDEAKPASRYQGPRREDGGQQGGSSARLTPPRSVMVFLRASRDDSAQSGTPSLIEVMSGNAVG